MYMSDWFTFSMFSKHVKTIKNDVMVKDHNF